MIATRTQRMALAGHSPSARDRKEFMRMGTEKLQAAGESAWALWAGAPAAMAVQQGAYPWLAAWGEWARLGSAGLAPIHAAATANARRLSRAKPRRRSSRR
ncbi:Hypothetical protein Rta_00400 [Ramlibacter tataouinensis TTB310]|uniref:Uncharacterized protein n=1 Tax=Ramlibacter tataouinensis (strain ATCC BAA-407 / DSM 14655 / LMG 21543 / TTB310) TaxID=365046 RepID=F5Y2C6_RAMTT|nr:Hypothetical protein Rta_00400 [Ramlibacter tataouinensis TTB310]